MIKTYQPDLSTAQLSALMSIADVEITLQIEEISKARTEGYAQALHDNAIALIGAYTALWACVPGSQPAHDRAKVWRADAQAQLQLALDRIL